MWMYLLINFWYRVDFVYVLLQKHNWLNFTVNEYTVAINTTISFD